MGSIPGSGRSTGDGNGNPFQYSCLRNPMDRGVWWTTVYRVTNSGTPRSNGAQHTEHRRESHVPSKVCGKLTDDHFKERKKKKKELKVYLL